MSNDSMARGLLHKFNVSRVDGRDRPGGDKDGADYFVLDLTHDPLAGPAMRAYSQAARSAGYTALADDIDRRLLLAAICEMEAEGA